jgi:hypothetical protein
MGAFEACSMSCGIGESKKMKMHLWGAAIFAAVVAAPAFAQTGTTGGTVTTTTAARDYDDDGSDWGWIGLLGLAGLAGLAPLFMRKDRTSTVEKR